jgi:hypothetical protein
VHTTLPTNPNLIIPLSNSTKTLIEYGHVISEMPKESQVQLGVINE